MNFKYVQEWLVGGIISLIILILYDVFVAKDLNIPFDVILAFGVGGLFVLLKRKVSRD